MLPDTGHPEEQYVFVFLTTEPSLQPVLRILEVAVVTLKSNSVSGKEQGLRTVARDWSCQGASSKRPEEFLGPGKT